MKAGAALALAAALAWALPAPLLAAPDGATPRTAKKRAAAPVVEPVQVGAVRYEVLAFGKARGGSQNGGELLARNAKSGAELYTLRVYTITYAANIEADKQDVHIADLALDADGKTLLVADERGRRYRVDTQTRQVTRGP